MKYKVLQPMIYQGQVYNSGDTVDFLEERVASFSIERGLIEKVEEPTSKTVEEEKVEEKKNSKKATAKKD